MTQQRSVATLNDMLTKDPGSFALLDVRETAEYNLSHIGGSCSLPRRLLEYRISQLVPWRGATVVVCDDDGVRANLAAATLEALGYTDVSVLTGGINRWVTEGHSTEWGLNVPSKDFGEKVLLHQHVPEVEPDELASWLDSGKQARSCSTPARRRSTTASASPAAAPCPAPSSASASGTSSPTPTPPSSSTAPAAPAASSAPPPCSASACPTSSPSRTAPWAGSSPAARSRPARPPRPPRAQRRWPRPRPPEGPRRRRGGRRALCRLL